MLELLFTFAVIIKKINMKKIFVSIIAFASIAFASCTKSDCDTVTTAAPAAEVAKLDSIIATKGITGTTKDSRGFVYKINSAGGTTKPTICNSVVVKYTGKFMNDVQFDGNTNGATFLLGNLVVGWQEAIPLIGKTGKISVWLPPSLAYGSAGSSSIPANSYLFFDIEILDF